MTNRSAVVHSGKRRIPSARRPSADSAQRMRLALSWYWPGALLAAALIWSYWPTVQSLMRDWRSDENYSVGQLVPLAALYLAWCDRKALAACAVRTCWWGLAGLLLAQVIRGAGLLWLYESAERYSMVLSVAALVLLVGGREVFRRSGWILCFLVLMVPLPGKVHNLISGPLQTFATTGAVAALEMLGVTVGREGNVMVLNDSVKVAVAEACSGLRMLTAFVVVSATLAYVVDRARWQKVFLLLSSVPVALFCNMVRLVITAYLFMVVSSDVGERFFHDFAGWTMMPLAVVLLLVELWIMSRMVIEPGDGKTS